MSLFRFRNSLLATGLLTQLSPVAYAQVGINLNGGAITNVAPAVNPSDAVIKQQLDDESAARIAGDQAEQSARNNVVNHFTTLLSSETEARIAGDQAEQSARNNVVNHFTTLLSSEAEAREAADTQLANSIATYVQDGQLSQARFDAEAIARTAAIAAESEARMAAVATETNARIAGDQALDIRISSESSSRMVADDALNLRIDREASARMAAVATETNARIAGDEALDSRISSESSARMVADDALNLRIDREASARMSADASEAASRLAADTALGTRIDNETRERMLADHAIRNEIASSTATAIALGGAVVLPDVNFTLAGNVATYKGAQAIAVNGAARVAQNTYVTSAVGGGLNKRGAVGARVGVVLGF